MLVIMNSEYYMKKHLLGMHSQNLQKNIPPPPQKKVYVYRKLHKMKGEIIAQEDISVSIMDRTTLSLNLNDFLPCIYKLHPSKKYRNTTLIDYINLFMGLYSPCQVSFESLVICLSIDSSFVMIAQQKRVQGD